MRACKLIFPMVFTFLCICIPEVPAMTIATHFIGGSAPANAVGGGDLNEIVETAARIWESSYSDDAVLDIYYGWGQVGDAGIHTLQQSDPLGREISGLLIFDNSGSVSFFLDPTPGVNEEYCRRTDEYQDLGGGLLNVARLFGKPAGDAAGRVDLLSVVLHEIGHALGLSASNAAFVRQGAGGLLQISENYPVSGTVIPLASNNAGIVPHFDASQLAYGSVMSGVNSDERRMPSELDILANAQISGFTLAASETVSHSQISANSRRLGSGGRGGAAGRLALGNSGPN